MVRGVWCSTPGRLLLVSVLVVAGCGESGNPAPEPTNWSIVQQGLPGALVSVAGTSATDIWTVGGDAEGTGPTVLRYDGTEWSPIDTGASGDLWWVHTFEGGLTFMGGENGLLIRYADGVIEEQPTPGTGTVYGIWGATPGEVWAVGGDGATGAFVWRYNGNSWEEVPGLPEGLADSYSFFKVWGRGANDVFFVGTGGIVMHWDGAAFTEVEAPTERTLFTVHCGGGRCATVGGFGTGVLLEQPAPDGEWTDVVPSGSPQMVGVSLGADGLGYAVGIEGSVLRREADGWVEEETHLDVFDDFHGCWVDPDGGVWAVGGHVLELPLTDGVMIYKSPGSQDETGTD